MTTRLLILACGNADRGDDALGPEFARRAHAHSKEGDIEILVTTQFQVEHAFDIRGRARVLFVDAAAHGPAPFSFDSAKPERDRSFSSHDLTPAAVLAACAIAFGAEAVPDAHLLAIRGYDFTLGAPATDQARANLEAALRWFATHLLPARRIA